MSAYTAILIGNLIFLVNLVKGLSLLFISSKNQVLFMSALIFIISFLLFSLGLVCCPFLVPLSIKLNCLLELFLVS